MQGRTLTTTQQWASPLFISWRTKTNCYHSVPHQKNSFCHLTKIGVSLIHLHQTATVVLAVVTFVCVTDKDFSFQRCLNTTRGKRKNVIKRRHESSFLIDPDYNSSKAGLTFDVKRQIISGALLISKPHKQPVFILLYRYSCGKNVTMDEESWEGS